ncbi:MAG: DoxX family protein [Flavisolibacter sp.]
MKKILKTYNNGGNFDFAILVARITIGALMLTHGLPKLAGLLSGGPVQFPPVFGLTPEISLGLAVFAEVFCSILIIIGLGTRFAVIPPAITMMVAVFSILAADTFSKKELAVFYLLSYVVLFFSGSGKYSADALLIQKRGVKSYQPVNHQDPALSVYQ